MNLNCPWLVFCVCRIVKVICFVSYKRFQRALKDPMVSQERVFKKLVSGLGRTEYGRYYGLNEKTTYREFISKVPIQTYDQLSPWLEKQLATAAPVMTIHPVIHVEPTSGSSGKRKRIPFTRPLMKAFGSMFCIWAYDHLANGLEPKTGKMFISVSPCMDQQAFENDAEFLSEPLRSLLKPFLVLPPLPQDSTLFQKNLALTLLGEPGLEIISIWSPSYLLTVLDYIRENRHELVWALPKDRQTCLSSEEIAWEKIWPNLKLISCWDNALAEPLANRLRRLFPNVPLQGKGLLATEAPVTVPLTQAGGCVPMMNEIFFEFELADGTIKCLHELKKGEEAQVILTQPGGLTRYRLNDRVQVSGFYYKTPKLRFIGRAGQICDLVGEKLHETFVQQALLPLLPSGQFVLLPYTGENSGYVLLVEEEVECLALQADQALREAQHYGYARQIGQLQAVQSVWVESLLQRLLLFQQSEGMALGDIKETALIMDPEKARRLLSFLNLGSVINRQS